jgi:predicted histone-like DNA-binding protein
LHKRKKGTPGNLTNQVLDLEKIFGRQTTNIFQLLKTMSIFYRKVRDNRKKSSTYGLWYGRAVNTETLTTDQLASKIAWSTTVTEADVIAVLKAAAHIINEALNMSQKVKLDNIGTFSIGLKTTSATSENEFSGNNIVGFRINFMPERKVVGQQATKDGKKTFKVVPTMTINSKAMLFAAGSSKSADNTSDSKTDTSASGSSSDASTGSGN